MRTAVIGAGAAGLVSAKNAVQSSIQVEVYEQGKVVGGTWNYNENIENDCHSSMYKNLRTNAPKEIMLFDGLNYDNIITDVSYLPSRAVLNYLNDYADKFNLRKYIKFESKILSISRLENEWKLKWKNLASGVVFESFYDAIFVCNGHYSVPMYPNYKGIDNFEGKLIHSHWYRVPEAFSGETVLMVGMGPSGQDIVFDLCTAAKKVYMSHHFNSYSKNTFPSNAEHRPDIAYFNERSVVLIDGSCLKIDTVLFCTGYEYNFPFLDESCGIKVDENYVYPLYKHMININHPTMVFIGIPYRTIIFPMFEIQVKCFLNILHKKAILPSKNEMKQWEMKLSKQGLPKRRYHMMMNHVRTYLGDLSKTGNVEPIPEVVFALFERNSKKRFENLVSYRDEVFTVVDPKTYTVKVNKV